MTEKILPGAICEKKDWNYNFEPVPFLLKSTPNRNAKSLPSHLPTRSLPKKLRKKHTSSNNKTSGSEIKINVDSPGLYSRTHDRTERQQLPTPRFNNISSCSTSGYSSSDDKNFAYINNAISSGKL